MNCCISTVNSISRLLNQVLELDFELVEIVLTWEEVELSELLLALEGLEVLHKLQE